MLEMSGYKLIGFLDANDDLVTPTGSFGQAIAIFRK
jgi:threonine synthase